MLRKCNGGEVLMFSEVGRLQNSSTVFWLGDKYFKSIAHEVVLSPQKKRRKIDFLRRINSPKFHTVIQVN